MKQDSQFARNCNDRTFLGVLPAPFGELQSPAPQISIRTKPPEDVLRRTHEQAAEVMITGFGDTQLRTAFSRLALLRRKPK
jgi:hypothetical protein